MENVESSDCPGGAADYSARDDLQIAVVLNGGVSLAVWMSGAVYEVDRFRCALTRTTGGSGSPEANLDRIARALMDITERRLVVDLVAGTSAGGINGALLGSAIANRRRLTRDNLLCTWLREGDMTKLLRPTPLAEPPSSMLRADETLKPGLQAALVALHHERKRCELPAETSVILTGTDLAGLRQGIAGSAPGYQEHRLLFRFATSEQRGWAPLTPGSEPWDDVAARLALAARCSSSFPGAFQPGAVAGEAWVRAAGGRPTSPPGSFPTLRRVVDGGVLDNSPFEPALRRIDAAPTGADLERTMLFVTPYDDPPAPPETSGLPGVIETVDAALALRGGLAGVANLTRFAEQSGRYQRVDRTTVRRELLSGWQEAFGAAAEGMLPAYRAARFRSALEELIGADAEEAIPREPTDWQHWLPRTLGGVLSPWCWGTAPVRRCAAFVAEAIAEARRAIIGCDSEARRLRRRLRDWERRARAVLSELSDSENERRQEYESGLGNPSCALHASWTPEIRAKRYRLFRRTASVLRCAASELIGSANDGAPLARQRLAIATELSLNEIVRRFLVAEVLVETGQRGAAAGAEIRPRLTLATIRGGSTGEPRQLFVEHRFGCEPVSADQKLLGMSLKHFGGFLFRSWRANDWMFGRLDAVAALVRLILSFDRVEEIRLALPDDDAGQIAENLRGAVLGDLEISPTVLASLRSLGAAGEVGADANSVNATVADYARTLMSNRSREIRKGALETLQTLVIWRLQLEILREEMPGIAAAVGADARTGARMPGAQPANDVRAPFFGMLGAATDRRGAWCDVLRDSGESASADHALEAFRAYDLPESAKLARQAISAPMVALIARSIFIAHAALGVVNAVARRGPASSLRGPLRTLAWLLRRWSAVPLWVMSPSPQPRIPALLRSIFPLALASYLTLRFWGGGAAMVAVGAADLLLVGPWILGLALSVPSLFASAALPRWRFTSVVVAGSLGSVLGAAALSCPLLDHRPHVGWVAAVLIWLAAGAVAARIERFAGVD